MARGNDNTGEKERHQPVEALQRAPRYKALRPQRIDWNILLVARLLAFWASRVDPFSGCLSNDTTISYFALS